MQIELFLVIQAFYAVGGVARFLQCGQQHAGEDRDDRNHDEELYQGENPYFLPAKEEYRTGNREGRRNGETIKQSSRKTFEQWKEEEKRKAKGLIPSSFGNRSQSRITADFDIGNKIMVGGLAPRGPENIFIRTEFRIQVQTCSLRYIPPVLAERILHFVIVFHEQG